MANRKLEVKKEGDEVGWKRLICGMIGKDVNHCKGSSETPNQVEGRSSKIELSRVPNVAERSRRQTQDTC